MVRLGMELERLPERDRAAAPRSDSRAAARRSGASSGASEVSHARASRRTAKSREATEQQTALRQTAQAQQEELAARRAEKAALAERLASAAAIAARMEQELQRTGRARARSGRCNTSPLLQRTSSNSRGRTRSSSGRWNRCAPKAAPGSAQAPKWSRNATRRACARREVDDALRMARQKLGDLREERSKHEIERARNDAEREHLRAVLRRTN